MNERQRERETETKTAGADPGFEKGRDTPKQSGENLQINDIHDLLNYVCSNV